MVNYDVLGVIQVTGQRHHVRAGELVCSVDSFIFTICPEDSILEGWGDRKQLIFLLIAQSCLDIRKPTWPKHRTLLLDLLLLYVGRYGRGRQRSAASGMKMHPVF